MSRTRGGAAILALATVLALLAVAAFWRLVAGDHFPASEDAAGHVYKSTVLIESLQRGQGVPVVFPGWYAGSEAFRYWPHLPYVLLALPLWLDPADPGLAVLVLIGAGLIAAGAGMLLWRRALGWPLTVLGVVLAALLADPLRVAFAEGNLPRVVAHAFFLPELAAAIAVARADRWHSWRPRAAALVAIAAVTVLCHAMMAAAAGAAIMLVLGIGWLAGRWSLPRTIAVGGLIGLGTALSGWWLVPSLSGGIAGTSSEAVLRGLLHYGLDRGFAAFAATDLPSSAGRASFYVGLALVLAAVAAVVHLGRRGSGWPFLAAGALLVAATLDPFALLYLRLPFANLLWPIRLQSLGQVLLLLGVLHAAADVFRPVSTGATAALGRARLARYARPAAAGLLGLIALDSAASLSLVSAQAVPMAEIAVGRQLDAASGWREATLDQSRLGSPPTLLWRDREQLYGWGIQGARNLVELVDLNEAIERGQPPSVLSQLDWWGVDDAILDRSDPVLEAALAAHGFRLRSDDGGLRHWARDGAPRALLLDPAAILGVGRNARVWTARFPQVLRPASEFVDDLTLDELRRYPTVVLAGPRWHDRARAEALIRDYAGGGGRVVVELADTPVERADRTNRFLGARAERIAYPAGGVSVQTDQGATALAPFDPAEGPWLATRYAGAIRTIGTVLLPDGSAAVVLASAGDSDRIVFVGLNLAYHGRLTADLGADALMERYGGLTAGREPAAGTIPLRGYRTDGDGYRFDLTLDQARRVVVPIARQERMTAWVDGEARPVGSLDDAVVLDLPAGPHTVRLDVAPGGNRVLGFALSGAALLALVGLLPAGPLLRRRANAPQRGSLSPGGARPIQARGGWCIAVQELQRTDRLAVTTHPSAGMAAAVADPAGTPRAAGDGPFAVVLAEVRNDGGALAVWDPQVVALVDARGRPFRLADAETAALATTVGALPPGASATPGVALLTALVYVVPGASRRIELVAAEDIARDDPRR